MKRRLHVIDSSVMVKWLNRQDEDYVSQADQIRHDARLEKIKIIAPELAKYEIGNALLYKNMDTPAVKLGLETLYKLPINFYTLNQKRANEILEIAKENKITYYDAAFIQLAREKNATLITANPKHHRQIKGVKIVDIKDY